MPPKYYGAAAQYNNKPSLKGGGGLDGKKIGLIAGLIAVVLAVVVGGLTLNNSFTKGPSDEFVTLAARTAGLQSLLDKQRAVIKNGDLKKTNAEAVALLATNTTDISAQAATLFGVAEIPEATVAAEGMGDAQEELDKAKTSGTYDRVYVTVITEKIALTYDLAVKMRDSVSGQEAVAAVEQLITNLTVIDDQLRNIQL